MLIERKYGENRRVKILQKLKFLAVFKYSIHDEEFLNFQTASFW